ncbi:MAG: hypothetical protein ACTTJC_00850 [Campylobacter sp.]
MVFKQLKIPVGESQNDNFDNSITSFLSKIHSSDVENFKKNLQAQISTNALFDMEFRIVLKDRPDGAYSELSVEVRKITAK